MLKKMLLMLSVILVMITSIAFSALSTSLAITSEVKFRPLADIRVNSIAMDNASGALIAYDSDYSKNSVSNGFILPTAGSSISYRVHIDNSGDIDYSIYDIIRSASANGVNVAVSGYNITDVIRAKTSVDLLLTYTTNSPSENVINVVDTFDFKKVYHVTYETGTNQVIPAQVKYEGVDLNLTNTVPTKDGYSFVKWNSKSDGTGINYNSGATYTQDEDLTLYARYSLNTYNINYVLSGGTNAISNPATYTIESDDIVLANATKEGYEFKGWTGNGTTTATKNLILPAGSFGDKTFTAHFEDETYPEITVTSTDGTKNYLTTAANINAGWGSVNGTLTYKINATDVGSGISKIEYAITNSSTPPTTGWAETTNGDHSDVKARGVYYIHVRATDLEDNVTTVTTKAQTVRFRVGYYDDYSKSTSITASQYYTGTALTTRTPSAVTGYTFDGWYSSSALTTKVVDANTTYTPPTSIKLFGKWNPIIYNITYSMNNGVNNANNPSTYTIESSTISLTAPTKTLTFKGNYNSTNGANAANGSGVVIGSNQTQSQTFAGWTGSNGDTSQTEVTIPTGSTGDKSYTAHWTAVAGTTPTVTRTGYTCGWSTTSTGTTIEIASGGEYSTSRITEGMASTVNLYAVCTPNSYSISYTMNGGNNPSPKPTTGVYDTDVVIGNPTKTFTVSINANGQGATLSANSASSTQTFAGWTSTTIGANALTGENASSYAPWNGTTSTATTYFKNLRETGTVTMVANWTPVNVTLPSITKTGYTCGYATSASGNIVYNGGASYTPSTTTNSVTLYAKCNPNTYNISYTLNNGTSGTNAPTSATYDANVVISNPTKTVTVTGNANGTGATVGASTSSNQTFAGWSSTTIGSNALTGTTASNYSSWNGTTKTTNTYFKNLKETGTVTMVANWTPVSVTLPTISKVGYVCKWYTEATGGAELGNTYTPTANSVTSITVYARCSEADDTPYRVNHYVHDLGTNTYTLNSHDDLYGETNATLIVANLKKTIPGFTYTSGYLTGNTTKPTSGAVTTTTILADGSRVINLYYRRNFLYVRYHINGGYLKTSHGEGYDVEGSLVTSISNNPSTDFFRGVYGGKVGRPDDDTYALIKNGLHTLSNSNGINLGKTGYTTISASMWNSQADGSGTSYTSGSSNLNADGFAGADLSTGDKVVTIYANWVPITYNITYSMNNGVNNANNPSTYTIESSAISLTAPTKTLTFKGNYNSTNGANAASGSGVVIGANTTKAQTFKGWTGSNGSTAQTSVEIPTGSTGDKNYTARWTAVAGTVPTVTREGYTCGWSTTSTGTTIEIASGGSYGTNRITEGMAAIVNLYAVCNPNTYTVTYNYNNASQITFASGEFAETGYLIDWDNDFTINGVWKYGTAARKYLVIGNYDDGVKTLNIELTTANKFRILMGDGAVDEESTTTVGRSTNITYAFNWNASTKTYTFTATGTSTNISMTGTYNVSGQSTKPLRYGTKDNRTGTSPFTTTTYHIGLSITKKYVFGGNLSNPTPVTKPQYAFNGWYTAATGGQEVTNSTPIPSTNATYYAQWTANTYQVKFNANGGVGTMPNESFVFDQSKPLTANAFTREGYTFIGWSTSTTGATSSIYYDQQSVSNLTKTNGGTVNLYALWRSNTYQVIYNGNNSTSGSMSNQTLAYGTTGTLTANAFTRTGYTYSSWNTNAVGTGANYNNQASVTINPNMITGTSAPSTLPTSSVTTGYAYSGRWGRTSTSITPTIIDINDAPSSLITKGFNIPNNTTSSNYYMYLQYLLVDYNQPYTLSVYAKGTGTLILRAGNSTPYKEETFTLTNTWTRYTMKVIPVNSNTAGTYNARTSGRFLHNIGFGVPSGNGAVQVAGLKFEVGETATEYVDTNNQLNLHAKWTANTYTIGYTMNGGNNPSPKPTSGTYDADVNIGNPTKTFTVNIDDNDQDATLSATSASSTQTFIGWSSSTIGSNAVSGANTSNYSSWNGTTKTTNTHFKNLRESGTVTMIANWSAVDVVLPTITKAGYTCGYATSASGEIVYNGGDSYTPSTTTNNVTLYAKCIRNGYSITYSMNNGTNNDNNPSTYNVESGTITLGNPYKILIFKGNYNATSGSNASNGSGVVIGSNQTQPQEFAGWTGSNGNTPQVYPNVTIPTGSTGNKNYTAHWTAVAGTVPTVTRTGYTCGWSTTSTGTTIEIASGGEYSTSRITEGMSTTINLYAVCTPKTYTLTIVPQGGTYNSTTSNSTKTMTYDSTNNNDIGVPTRSGYTFDGWYIAAGNKNSQIFDNTGKNTALTGYFSAAYSTGVWKHDGNVTIYAHWSKTASSLTKSVSPTSYIYDDNDKEPSTIVKDGNNTLTRGTDYTVTYTNNHNVGTATATITGAGVYNSTTKAYYTGSAGVNFAINNAKITFNTNNCGTISGTSPVYVRKGENGVYTGINNSVTATIPVVSKSGYTFTGWYDGNTKVINADRTVVSSVTGWTDSSKKWLITEDKELTASCSKNGYTITYSLNNGIVSPPNPDTYDVEDDPISLINPTKTLIFKGNPNATSAANAASGTVTIGENTTATQNFSGWSGTGLTGNNNTTVIIPTGSTGNRSYTAHYTAVTTTLPTVTKPGFVCGWNASSTGTTIQYLSGATYPVSLISESMSATVNLYAVCNADTFDLIIHPEGGNYPSSIAGGKNLVNIPDYTSTSSATIRNVESSKLIDVKYKNATQYTVSANVSLSDTSKSFGVFARYTDQSYSYLWLYNNGVAYPSVTTASGKTVQYLQFSYNASTNVTMSNFQLEEGATATAYEAYVSQNTTTSTTRTMTFDTKYNNDIGIPTRSGYTFDGWYLAPDDKDNQMFSSTGKNVALSGYWSAAYSTGVWKRPADTNVYAHWSKAAGNLNKTITPTSYIYDNTDKEPTITVMDGETLLVEGTDYTVAYNNNRGVGQASATISGTENYNSTTKAYYTGNTTSSYTITNAKLTFNKGTCANISDSTPLYTRLGATAVYTGLIETTTTGIIPTASKTGYTFNGWYTLSSGGSKVLNADGTFAGNVAGYTNGSTWQTIANQTLYARCSANDLTFNNQTLSTGTYGVAYTSNAFTAATNGTGSYTYTLVSGYPTGATINSANRTISFTNSTNAGTYNVVVRVTDNNSNKTKDATMTIVINKAKITIPTSPTAKIYNGASQASGITTPAHTSIVATPELVTNGDGSHGDNTNFTSWTYDSANSYNGSTGSFKSSATNTGPRTNEFFALSQGETYTLSVDAKSANGSSKYYSFIAFYDIDKKEMSASQYMYVAGSTTTLARELKNGDTVVYLTDLSGWNTTTTNSGQRGFIFWNYTNNQGFTYPIHTYSRNVYTNRYAGVSSINVEAGTITLSSAWTNGTFPAGTPVSQSGSGSTYKYTAMNNVLLSTSWNSYTGTVSGIDYSGTNVSRTFPPYAVYGKVGFLWNREGNGDTGYITNVSVTGKSMTSGTNVATYAIAYDIDDKVNYEWSDGTTTLKTVPWIINPKDITATATLGSISDQIYTGNAITPEPTVMDGNTLLEKNIDYTLIYRNNTEVGQATVEIIFRGNYSGTKTVNFYINNAELTFYAGTCDNVSGTTTLYTRKNAQGVYTGLRNSESGVIPTATKSGYTFTGWYTAAEGGSKVLNANGTFTGSGVSGYTNATSWQTLEDKELYARCSQNTFNITYAMNNGTNDADNPSTYTVNSPAITLEQPTKTLIFKGNHNSTSGANASSSSGVVIGANTTTAQTFAGWTGSNGSTAQTSVTIPTGSTGDKSYTAHWTAVAGTVPTVTREGYTCGWSTTSTGTTIEIASGGSYGTNRITEGMAATVNLYAVCKPNIYTITLNNQGATTAGTTTIYEKYATGYYLTNVDNTVSDQMTTSANGITIPVREGYTFAGYYTAASGGTQYIGANGKLTSSASTTQFSTDGNLYAHWTKPISELNSELSTLSYIYDGNAKTPTPTVTDGETTLVNNTDYTVTYEDNINVGMASATIVAIESHYNSTTMAYYTGNTTLTFYIINAKLQFNAGTCEIVNGPTDLYTRKGSTVVYTGERNSTLGTIPTASKAGSTFLGWYNSSSNGTKVLNADGSFTGTGVSNYTNATSWQVVVNKNLYAYCSAGTYTVTANANSGSISSTTGWTGTGNTATKSVTYNSEYGTLPNVSRVGYEFNGWSLLPEGYTQVEYIESTGTQYIDTGYIPSDSGGRIESKASFTDFTVITSGESNLNLYGVESPSSPWNLLGLRATTAKRLNFLTYGNSSAPNANIVENTVYTFEQQYSRIDSTNYRVKCTFDGTVIRNSSLSSSDVIRQVNMYVFASNINEAKKRYSKAKLYYFRMYDGDNLVRDLVPCIKDSTGKAGMYDIVNNVFYGNSGTGDFIAGNPSYITSSTIVKDGLNHTIYAKWTPSVYTLTFDATTNGGTLNGSSPLYVMRETAGIYTTAGITTLATVPTATKTGWTFTGWYSGNTKIINTDGSVVASVANWTDADSNWLINENKTLTAKYEMVDPNAPTITGGNTSVYNYADRQLTCSTSSSYASGTSVYYEFGYATSAENFELGNITWLGNASTNNKYVVVKDAFLATRYYTCRIYTSDGVTTSDTIQATTTTQKSIVNARIYFDATTNGGAISGNTRLYVPYGSTSIYTGRQNTTPGTIPSGTKTGWTFNGWYTAATGGTQVINSSGVVQASVADWTDASKNWLRTNASANDTVNALYAQYTVNNYTISYTMNNGPNPATKPTSGTYGSDVVISNPGNKTITVTGNANGTGATIGSATTGTQTFSGWTSSTLGNNALAGANASSYAAWTGTSTKNTYFKNLKESGTVTMVANWSGTVTLPTLSKPGHTCKWYTTSGTTGGSLMGNSGATWTIPSGSVTSVTAYARCTVNQYTLTLRPNGGIYNGSSSNVTVTQDYGTTYNVPNTPTKEGYTFTGWKKTSGSGTYEYIEDSSITPTSTSTLTYNAANSTRPTVYNNAGGGTVTNAMVADASATGGYSLNVVTNGTASPGAGGIYFNLWPTVANRINVLIVRAKIPTGYSIKLGGIGASYTGFGSNWVTYDGAGTGDWKTYYITEFAGTTGNLGERVYMYIDGSNNTSVSWNVDSITVKSYTKDQYNGVYTFGEGNGQLTAQWGAGGAKVTWDKQGGIFGDGTIGNRWTAAASYFTYTSAYTDTKKAPYYISDSDFAIYKPGYTFVGWYTAASGGTQVFDATGKLKASVSGYSDADRKWQKYDSNITLYARWATESYTVTYNTTENGGTGTIDSATVAFGDSVPLPTTGASKAGWTFVGWNTDKNATSALSSLTMGSDDITLYAIYRKEAVTLNANWNANGATLSSSAPSTCSLAAVYNNNTQATSCTVTAPTITRANYDIIGWNQSASATTNDTSYNTSTGKLTLTSSNTNNTWYAITKTQTALTATFAANNGATVSSNSATCYLYGTSTWCEVNAPTVTAQTGFRHIGFNTSADSNSNNTNYTPSTGKLRISANNTWYPITESNTSYTAEFRIQDTNAVNQTTSSVFCYRYNGATSCSVQSPTLTPKTTDYIIVGWGLTSTSTDAAYANGASIPITADITFYSITYLDDEITITFNRNITNSKAVSQTPHGGSASTAVTVESRCVRMNGALNCSVISPTMEVLNGYHAVGYNTTPNAQSSVWDVGTAKDVSANATYYAITAGNSYSIKFNANCPAGITPTGSMSNLAMTYGTAKNLTANAFGCAGRVFNGWATNAQGTGTTYSDGESVNNLTPVAGATVNLYAKWRYIDPTPTISGGTSKIYGVGSTTLTCTENTSYPTGTNKYYSFGYTTSANGNPGDWTNANQNNTLVIQPDEYVGTRYYSCRVYVSNGTEESNTVTSASPTTNSINNAKITFKPGTCGTENQIRYVNISMTGVYTGIGNTTVGTMPTLSKAGYTFSGWYDGNTKVVNADGSINSSVTGWTDASKKWLITADSELTAVCVPNDYSLTYLLNNGVVSPANPDTYNIDSNPITLRNPTKILTFTGNPNATSGANAPNGTVVIGTNKTAEQEFVGWSGTGLTGNNNTTVTIPTGSTGNRSYTAHYSAVTSVTPTVTRTGYTCGWNRSSTGTTKEIDSGAVFPIENISESMSATVNLYAVCTPKTYTINYACGNDATGTPPVSATATYNSAFTVATNANTCAKPGYEFAGWVDTTDADWTNWSGIWVYDNGQYAIQDNEMTLYAVYSPVNYTITYNLDGGDAINPVSYNIETETFTLENPTRLGYEFAGWTGTGLNSATTTVTIAQGSTGNRSYTATWIANNYYLDLNALINSIHVDSFGGCGTADVYVNNTKVANDVSDYHALWPTGSTYEIKDIKVTSGTSCTYTGETTYSGTINGSNTIVDVPFTFASRTFNYTGNMQTFVVPVSGQYRLEVWGAQGGTSSSHTGGLGGYTNVSKCLTGGSSGDTLYVGVGGTTATANGGWNGGGCGNGWNASCDCGAGVSSSDYTTSSTIYAAGGGGATHIGTVNAQLRSYTSDQRNPNYIYAVAGGGGGGSEGNNGGAGGKLNGLDGYGNYKGYGGSSTLQAGGAGGYGKTSANGSFGQGGTANRLTSVSTGVSRYWAGGGGGGLYGGGGGDWSTSNSSQSYSGGGGGGSGTQGLTGYPQFGGTGTAGEDGVRTGNGQAIITWEGVCSSTATTYHDIVLDYNINQAFTAPAWMDTYYTPIWTKSFDVDITFTPGTSGKRYFIFGNYDKTATNAINLEVNTSNQLALWVGPSSGIVNTTFGSVTIGSANTVHAKWDATTGILTITTADGASGSYTGYIPALTGAGARSFKFGSFDYRQGDSNVFESLTVNDFVITEHYASPSGSAITLPDPAGMHLLFDGWTGSNGSTAQYNVTVPSGSNTDMTYTANWSPGYAFVSYDSTNYSTSNDMIKYEYKMDLSYVDKARRKAYVQGALYFWRTNTGYTTTGSCYLTVNFNGSSYSRGSSSNPFTAEITHSGANLWTRGWSNRQITYDSVDYNADGTATMNFRLTAFYHSRFSIGSFGNYTFNLPNIGAAP